MSNKDLYQILNVSKEATPSELKTAHREAVLKYHPDIVGQTPESLEKFREIQEAYKVLSTPDLKNEYDLSIARKINKPPVSTAKVVPGSATASIYGIQQQNFQSIVEQSAGANLAQNLPKYRLEKWKKIPLEKKKLSRVRPVWNFRSLSSHYAPYLLSIGLTLGIYAYYSSPQVRYASFIEDIQPAIIRHSDSSHKHAH